MLNPLFVKHLLHHRRTAHPNLLRLWLHRLLDNALVEFLVPSRLLLALVEFSVNEFKEIRFLHSFAQFHQSPAEIYPNAVTLF